jgi:hypothetical protein
MAPLTIHASSTRTAAPTADRRRSAAGAAAATRACPVPPFAVGERSTEGGRAPVGGLPAHVRARRPVPSGTAALEAEVWRPRDRVLRSHRAISGAATRSRSHASIARPSPGARPNRAAYGRSASANAAGCSSPSRMASAITSGDGAGIFGVGEEIGSNAREGRVTGSPFSSQASRSRSGRRWLAAVGQ